MVGIRPDVLPDERFVPGPLPLLSEGVLLMGVSVHTSTYSINPGKFLIVFLMIIPHDNLDIRP